MHKLRILVLVHETLVPPQTLEGVREKDADEYRTEYDVVSSLAASGHDVRPLTWSVPVERLRAIREFVAEAGDVRWLLAFDIEGEDAWLQSPANANGVSQALAALGTRLGANLQLELEQGQSGTSRVVWRKR